MNRRSMVMMKMMTGGLLLRQVLLVHSATTYKGKNDDLALAVDIAAMQVQAVKQPSPNLIQNGDFEGSSGYGSTPGWTSLCPPVNHLGHSDIQGFCTRKAVYTIGSHLQSYNGKAAGNVMFVCTDCTRISRHGVYQDISTVAGVSYSVTFDHIDAYFSSKQPLTEGNVYLEVQSPVGTSVLDVSHVTTGDATHNSFNASVRGLWDSAGPYTFTAAGATSRVWFYVGARACPILDNVAVRMAAAPASPSAKGDPHMTNVLGQHFDLMQPGNHTMILVPKQAVSQHALLQVRALVQNIGGGCEDLYIQRVSISGRWVRGKGGLPRRGAVEYFAGRPSPVGRAWTNYGKVGLKVVWGQTNRGVEYLNLLVRRLDRAGYPVGGLLGEDDHTKEAARGALCRRRVDV